MQLKNIFGLSLPSDKQDLNPSIIIPDQSKGEMVTSSDYGPAIGSGFNQVMDFVSNIKDEAQMINRYRAIAQYADVDNAINDITDEAIVMSDHNESVKIILEDVHLPENIKNKIVNEFETIKNLYNYENNAYYLFRQWYIDGRLYFNVIIDQNNIRNGLVELRMIDPLKIRKKVDYIRKKNKQNLDVVTSVNEYYLYNDKGLSDNETEAVMLSKDSVVFVPSGVVDYGTHHALSHLQKALKPATQLKYLEDSIVIYRIARAPERRVFYVDVGRMNGQSAQQFVNQQMNRFRNKTQYDATTGEMRSNTRHMSMLEDFWLPRREGSTGTEVKTLASGENLGNIADIEFFQKKLYHSLNVPTTRLEPSNGFNLGRTQEITRDEIAFNKFIVRLRKEFSKIFTYPLRIQLILKGIITESEWKQIEDNIRYDFLEDNHFAELKEQEVMQGRIQMVQMVEPYIGTLFSLQYVKTDILHMDDDTMNIMMAQIEQEKLDGTLDDFNKVTMSGTGDESLNMMNADPDKDKQSINNNNKEEENSSDDDKEKEK